MTITDRPPPSFLLWEDPPRSRNRPLGDVRRHSPADPVYLRMVAELREHPGRWARVATFEERRAAASEVNRLSYGREGAFFPPHEFEFTSRTNRVYARYLGATR